MDSAVSVPTIPGCISGLLTGGIFPGEGRKLLKGGGELHDHWDTNQWESDYSLAPDGNHLAYRISETGLIGFAGPTAGHMLDLSQRSWQGPVFLAASVYAMDWDSKGNFYACTSHSEHRRVIVHWDPSF